MSVEDKVKKIIAEKLGVPVMMAIVTEAKPTTSDNRAP